MSKNNMPVVVDSMVVHPSIQQIITQRFIEAGSKGIPAEGIYDLGDITLPDNRKIKVYGLDAVDAILIDPEGNTVTINRFFNPGKGKEAAPGGIIDPVKAPDGNRIAGNAIKTVLNELAEETGIGEKILQGAEIIPCTKRAYNRPFDIREAFADDKPIPGIKKGNFFIVSTQGYLVRTKVDLSTIALKAGDDATKAQVRHVSELQGFEFGIRDHLYMFKQAALLAGASLRPTLMGRARRGWARIVNELTI